MKKHFYFLLMATLVCGLSMSVTSCKDDDKDNNGGGESGEDLGPQNEQIGRASCRERVCSWV